MEEYYELASVVEVPSADALSIPRARALFEAVTQHRDYAAVQLLQHSTHGIIKIECVVADVECDGVPPKNPFGIRYRERVALCVPADRKLLVEVLALRKDFPLLMHQNQGLIGTPASLCLYFESPASVLRTWTPQRFLRRIQWWLEKSARGELHPADQPVEQLFFASKYELVLPWNLRQLRASDAHRFVVERTKERPNGGFTCFLRAIPKDSRPKGNTVAYVELTVPPIMHGFVERDPATLGGLADVLSRRGTDLLAALRNALQERVDAAGQLASADEGCTILLLVIPICRTEESEPVAISHRAFVLERGPLELGRMTGCFMFHQGRYYKDFMNTQVVDSWRSQPVMSVEVLSQNDGATLRQQSGIAAEGPTGVLIGAGSLGSAMLNLWGRIGWGRWTVIDKDHIKPHNLSRHTAYTQHIGETKSDVVAELQFAATDGAIKVSPINGDATDFTREEVSRVLKEARLVVDASTTLEYPRGASAIDGFGRHISVFITPNGNSAVLLAEDARRSIRLRTLEAQYYRAVIQEEWGSVHLTDNGRSFWSGASCRDISTVISYSRIMAQASILAEQIPIAAAQEAAVIRVWQRDPLRGTVTVHDVPTLPERSMKLGEFDFFIDAGIEEQIRELRQQAFPNETGGILLGYHDFNIGGVIVVSHLPAPPDSKAGPDSFERGIAGLADAVNQASKRTGEIVGYVGEWHSHPPGHSASPSRDDLLQLIHLALGMSDDGLPAVQLIIGERELQVVQGMMQ